jgi:hypothetical protein
MTSNEMNREAVKLVAKSATPRKRVGSRVRAALFVLVCAPSVVGADGIAAEVSAGSAWIASRLSGMWDVDDRFALQLDYSVTRSESYAQNGALSLSYVASDHWSLGLSGSWSPASMSSWSTTLEMDEDARLSAVSSTVSLVATATYDTAGDTDHETQAGLSLGVDHVQSQQTFACMCDAELAPLWSQLSRFAINASVSRTEYRDTDLGLDATYYIYDVDPRYAGYFRLPGIGQLGSGIAIAPLRYAVAPSVGNRWGKLTGTLGLAYGENLADEGFELAANVRFHYKLSRELRLSASIARAWNVDAFDELSTSSSLSLGGKYAW